MNKTNQVNISVRMNKKQGILTEIVATILRYIVSHFKQLIKFLCCKKASSTEKKRGPAAMVKCPVCGKECKNLHYLTLHIFQTAQSSEIGMGRDRAMKHKRWLVYKGVNSDYESVRRYLEQIIDT